MNGRVGMPASVPVVLAMLLAVGCEPATEDATTMTPEARVGPGDGRTTATGYVSDYFGFGIGFSEDWSARPIDQDYVRSVLGEQVGLLLISRQDPWAYIKIFALPLDGSQRSARDHLAEALTPMAPGCELTRDVHEDTLAGRLCARADLACFEDIFYSFVYFLEQDHLVMITLQGDMAAAKSVIGTLTFYD